MIEIKGCLNGNMGDLFFFVIKYEKRALVLYDNMSSILYMKPFFDHSNSIADNNSNYTMTNSDACYE
jgi:hypothetical protein